jgi:hypothetical protein
MLQADNARLIMMDWLLGGLDASPGRISRAFEHD